jgi:hypothetical protein
MFIFAGIMILLWRGSKAMKLKIAAGHAEGHDLKLPLSVCDGYNRRRI